MSRDQECRDVADFHTKFGMLVSAYPTHLRSKLTEERLACLKEEVQEFADAAAIQDLDGMADALVDLVYFAKGTAVMMGLPWQELWDDVQRANMAKVRGVGKRGHRVDMVKPPGWQGPRTREILTQAGYNRGRHFDFMGVFHEHTGADHEQG